MRVNGARDALVMLLLGLATLASACAARTAAPSGLDASPPASSPLPEATVARHTDGDTLRVLLPDGSNEPVRLIGIDAPEVAGAPEPLGAEAADFTARAAPLGHTVYLETDESLRDRYGRLLAYVWLERPEGGSRRERVAESLQGRLLAAGLAFTMDVPPNDRYAAEFLALQERARTRRAGVWATR